MRVDLRFHVPNGAKGPGSYKMQADVLDHTGETADAVDSDKEMRG